MKTLGLVLTCANATKTAIAELGEIPPESHKFRYSETAQNDPGLDARRGQRWPRHKPLKKGD